MAGVSTRNLELLPQIDDLKRLLQSLATLDLIMSPEWQYRYYSYDTKWAASKHMGSMRNGMGDEFFAVFNDVGCFITGFAHESPMTPYHKNPPTLWPGMLEGVPDEFKHCTTEPAFSMDSTTFCIWRKVDATAWSIGPIDMPEGDDVDGSEELLLFFDGQPSTYVQHAKDYFEESIPPESVQHIYNHKPLSEEIITSLNAEITLKDIEEDLAAIGYA